MKTPFSTEQFFGVYQDFMMLIAAIVANIWLLRSKEPRKVWN